MEYEFKFQNVTKYLIKFYQSFIGPDTKFSVSGQVLAPDIRQWPDIEFRAGFFGRIAAHLLKFKNMKLYL